MASAMYGVKWKRDWAVNDLDYNPIWNVDGRETETTTRTPDLTRDTTRTPDLNTEATRTPNLTRDSTRTPDLTHDETRTPNLTQKTDYGKSDTLSFTNRHDKTTTTPELTRKVMGSDGYTEDESETVPGYTDQHTVADRTRNEFTFGFNSGGVADPSARTTDTENSSDTRTAGQAGKRHLEVTGAKTEEYQRVAGGDGISDTEKTGSEQQQAGGSDTQTTQGSEHTLTQESGIDQTVEKETGTDTTTTKQTGTDKTTEHQTGTDVTVIKKERGGNIGVTMTQQMINAERETNAWLFFDSVLQDLDRLFTIPLYF